MATIIDSLLLKLGLDSSEFAAGKNKVDKGLKDTGNEAEKAGAKLKKTGVKNRGIGFAHAGRATGKDDGRRLHCRHLRGGGDAGMYFGVNPGFAHAARDKLGNL